MKILLITLAFALPLLATEARVESMGSNDDFIMDEISVSKNPSTAFDFGNTLVGSLGTVFEAGTGWDRKEQWFGGWTVYPLKPELKVLLGATVNKPFDATNFYSNLENTDFFLVSNGNGRFLQGGDPYVDFLEVLDMRQPYGNIYLFTGVSLNDNLNIAVGGRYAGNKSESDAEESALSIAGGNLGVTYKFGAHSIEAGIDFNQFDITKEKTFTYHYTTAVTRIDTAASEEISLSSSDNNVDVFVRSFVALSAKNKLVPVLSLTNRNLLGISNQDLGLGVGFNRDLHKGFIWAGAKYVYHTAKYPVNIAGQHIYSSTAELPSGVEETSNKFVYSFGVEKKLLWDWFTIRVGGNKVYEYLEVNKGDFVIKRGLFERDVDAVGWGIALGTADDRLKFDVTMSEAFPYSNILSGGEDGVLVSRISAALKF